jgi:type I restriction enzyme S subunit
LYGKGVILDAPADGGSLKMQRHQIAKTGQVILSEIWGKKGAIGFVPAQGEGALCTSHFFLFDVLRDRIESDYLDWIFTANVLEDQLNAEAKGSTGYAAVRPKHLLACGIPLPSLSEQRRIVAKIEELAAKIADAKNLRERAVEAAATLPSCYTSQLFDKLKSWPQERIRTLGIDRQNPVQTGPFGAQLHASDFVEIGVPVLNVGNVWPQGLRLDHLDHVLLEKAQQLGRYTLDVGDLLFARSGATLGKVCLVPDGCRGWLMTGHLFRVRFDPSRVLNRFAFAALRSARSIHEQVFGQVRGATRPGYNTTLLSNIELPLPPLAFQHEVVSQLEAFEHQVNELRGAQDGTTIELSALMATILDRALKGEL